MRELLPTGGWDTLRADAHGGAPSTVHDMILIRRPAQHAHGRNVMPAHIKRVRPIPAFGAR